MKTVILLGAYNGAKYIEKQIESFFYQTVLPNELIISDDCSKDNTVEIVKKLSEKSPFPITIIENDKNIGYTRNFEALLSYSKGDVIFFSDQDDYWLPEKIEKVLNEFGKSADTMVVINDMILADGDLNPTEYTQLKNIRKIGMSDDTFVAGCAVAIRNEWKKIIMPFPIGYEGHDNWIVRLATITSCRKIIEEPLQLYRRHGLNVSQSFASRTEKISKFDAALSHGLQSAENGWLKELERIMITKKRLNNKKDFFVKRNCQQAHFSALHESNLKIRVYKARISNVRKDRFKRFLPLFRMFLNGDYQIFSGYKSFVKDLIR